jgi:tRNA wybutosine-synthesizing protein 3
MSAAGQHICAHPSAHIRAHGQLTNIVPSNFTPSPLSTPTNKTKRRPDSSPSPTTWHGMDPPVFDDILPDSVDSADAVLPSFPSLRRKTWETLYRSSPTSADGVCKREVTASRNGDLPRNSSSSNSCTDIKTSDQSRPRDKSPKGSVDHPIQTLVNLINFHPSFATLSSCSGRIALYDALCKENNTSDEEVAPGEFPSESAVESTAAGTITITTTTKGSNSSSNNDNKNNHKDTTTIRHGKGTTGGWKFVSHTTIDTRRVVRLIRQGLGDSSSVHDRTFLAQTLSFEPLLLHVAASNLKRGRQLLQVALRLGFRESGLLVTDTRVTVAIRSYALAWQIPLADGLPEEYLVTVLERCNERLQTNHDKMCLLQEAIHNALFLRRPQILQLRCAQRLPPLNLWGHAAVIVPSTTTSSSWPNRSDQSLVVFGGYGTGPMGSSKCERSTHIYRLAYNSSSNTWSHAWEVVNVPSSNNDRTNGTRGTTSWRKGILVQMQSWKAKQSLAACFHKRTGFVVVFGGRSGPMAPSQDLYLFDIDDEPCLASPVHVLGQPPSPRWGHSMTSTAQGSIVVLGGRDANKVFSDVHVLSFVHSETQGVLLQWTKIETPLPSPLCFHCAALVPPMRSNDNQLYVWGGISRVDALLPNSAIHGAEPLFHWVLDMNKDFAWHNLSGQGSRRSLIGHAGVSAFVTETSVGSETHVLYLGGTGTDSPSSAGDPHSQPFLQTTVLSRRFGQSWSCSTSDGNARVSVEGFDKVSSTLWVHHSACGFVAKGDGPFCQRIVVVGGGVQGFAFGPMFAESAALQFELSFAPSDDDQGAGASESGSAVVATNTATVEQCDTAASSTKSAAATHSVANVFYVEKRQAKALKLSLQEQDLLDKRYRMCPADSKTIPPTVAGNAKEYIAVPVVAKAIVLYKKQSSEEHPPNGPPRWSALVRGMGEQHVLLSSSMFARR